MTRLPSAAGADLGAALNPAFLKAHGIVPIDATGSRLVVAMDDPGDLAAIAALAFAAGCPVDARPHPAAIAQAGAPAIVPERGADTASNPLAAIPAAPAMAPSTAMALAPAPRSVSLADRVRAPMRAPDAALLALAALIEAGIALPDAGRIAAEADAPGQPGEALARRLADGADLPGALAATAGLPGWWHGTAERALDAADQRRLFAAGVRLCAAHAETRQAMVLRRVALAGAWAGVALLWGLLSAGSALVAGALGLWLVARIAPPLRVAATSDGLRAEVLGITATLAAARIAPAASIALALRRLDAVRPTWGRLPETRADLARALELPALPAALLEHGALDVAAARAATACRAAADAQEREGVRLAVLAALAAALAALLCHAWQQ